MNDFRKPRKLCGLGDTRPEITDAFLLKIRAYSPCGDSLKSNH